MVDAHPDGDSGAPPVAICCAASDEPSVREAAEALEARGHQVQVAVGVDADQEVLVRAIATQQGRGLFVLCRSHTLDRNAVDQLREILREHDVPFGRTLTLAVDTQRPREVEERIVSVLRRMVTGRADGRPRAWGSAVPQHEEDPDTTIRRPGAAPASPAAVLVGLGTEPENADPYASTSQIEMMQRDVAPQPYPPYMGGADHTAVSAAPRPPQPMPASLPPQPMPPVSAMPAAPGSEMPSPRPIAPMGPSFAPEPSMADGVPPDASSTPKLTPSMPMSSSASMSDAMAGYTPAPVSADESSADFEPPLTVGGRMGRALGSPAGLAVVLGGLAVVVLATLGVMLLGDDGDEAQASSTAATKASEDDAAKAKANDGEDSKADAKTEVDAEPEANATPEADAKPEPNAKPEPADAESPPAAAADPGEAREDGPAEQPARTLDPGDDPPEVVAALRAREVRALDLFLVAPERKGNLAYEQAVAYCGELEVAGLTDWRVPLIGELNAVAGAKMLGKAVYWSATPGDSFGDEMLVVNTKKGNSISVVTKGWDGAKIVCIRPRQP